MFDGIGETASEIQPVAVGGGTAAGVTILLRVLSPAGSVPSRFAGLGGMLAGSLVAVLTKQGGRGVASAVLVGGAVQLTELATEKKVAGLLPAGR